MRNGFHTLDRNGGLKDAQDARPVNDIERVSYAPASLKICCPEFRIRQPGKE